jgi:hypothetical protein
MVSRLITLFLLAGVVCLPLGATPAHEISKHATAQTPASAVHAFNIVKISRLQLTDDTTYVFGARPQITDLYASGERLIVGSFINQLYFVDISDPSHMRRSATLSTAEAPVDIKVVGDYAYVGLQDPGLQAGGLLVLDIAQDQPRVLAEVALGGNGGAHNLFVYRDRVYVAHSALHAEGRGISIINVEDPTTPRIVVRWTEREAGFSNIIHDIYIEDDIAYLCDIAPGQGGLIVLDLSNPDKPQSLATLSIPEGLHSAWKVGDYLYCNQEFGGWGQKLYIVDVADPSHPRLVGDFKAVGLPAGQILGPHNPIGRDGLMYWAYYDAGFRVFDLSDPERPDEIAYHTGSFAWSAQPHDDGLIYVTDSGKGGVAAYRLDRDQTGQTAVESLQQPVPQQARLLQNYPNPFNGTTVIKYWLEHPAAVVLDVYATTGQRLRRLSEGWREQGDYTAHWDGRDDKGGAVASGLYWYRLKSDTGLWTRSMLLLR